MRRLALIVLLLLPGLVLGQTSHHAPYTTPNDSCVSPGNPSSCCQGSGFGDCDEVNAESGSVGQQSGLAWYEAESVWVGCSQNDGYFVFNSDMSSELGSCLTGDCGNCNGGDCEALAISGDVLYCIGENSGGTMASFDLADWATGGWDTNGLDQLEEWNTSPLFASNMEGLAAVPNFGCAASGCENDTAFIASNQSGGAYAIYLDDDSSGYTNIGTATAKYYPPCGSPWGNNDWCGLDYDPVGKLIYWSSDAGAALCIATAPVCSDDASQVCFNDSECVGTCTATAEVDAVSVGLAANNGEYESLAVCPDCGYIAVADDGRTFAVIEDTFCGDDIASTPETCDGTDLDDKDCSNCGEGDCGAGKTGVLTCAATCDAFVTGDCEAAAGGRRRVLVTGVIP